MFFSYNGKNNNLLAVIITKMKNYGIMCNIQIACDSVYGF